MNQEKVNNLELPDITDIDSGEIKKLILYNSHHFFNEVILQLHKATGFDLQHCEQIALIAHYKGKAIVKSAPIEELRRIDSVLKEIGLITAIE